MYGSISFPQISDILHNYGTTSKPGIWHWCSVCIVLCHFLTSVDSCNHQYNQDAELYHHYKVLPYAIFIITYIPFSSHSWALANNNLTFDKGTKSIQRRNNSVFNKWHWNNWTLQCKKRKKLDLKSHSKINSKWIRNINVKHKTWRRKHTRKIRRKIFGLGKEFWDKPKIQPIKETFLYWTSSKFCNSHCQENERQTRRKFLQITYLTMDSYPEYIKSFQNSTIRQKIQFKMGRDLTDLNRCFTKECIRWKMYTANEVHYH